MAKSLIVIAHDIRSAHNVGSLFRTCEGLGVRELILSGYTPRPPVPNDTRLPHIGIRQEKQINKTALGAEQTLKWSYSNDIVKTISRLKKKGFSIAGLEQSERSTNLAFYAPPEKLAILLGREVEGIDPNLLKLTDSIIEIHMKGKKESLNVVQAASIAIYHCLL